jgi:hypothetical protein
MSKFILPIFITLIFFIFSGKANCNGTKSVNFEDIESFVKKITKKIKDIVDKFNQAKNTTNSTEIVEKLNTSVLDTFSQSAIVQRVSGIKDQMLTMFIKSLMGRLRLPQEYLTNITSELSELSNLENSEWQSYKFMYNKESDNNTCYYVCLLAQHDITNKKSNWMYTELNTKFNLTSIFVVTKSQTKGSKLVNETIEIIKKPTKYNQTDIEYLMEYYEAAAIKSLSNFLGIRDDQDAFNKKTLKFLEI